MQIYDGRKSFCQWDLNQKLIVSEPCEVHFCNGTSDCSLVCETYEEDGYILVNVPNILLQTAKNIRAYAYVTENDEKYTKEVGLFGVQARSKPDDYIYTETEVKSIESVVDAALQDAIDSGKLLTETDRTLSVPDIPADAEVTGTELKRRSLGMTSRVAKFTCAGWKRVAVLTRRCSGTVDICLGGYGRAYQNIVLGFSGYADYPAVKVISGASKREQIKDANGHPRLWQTVNHTFGENPVTTPKERVLRIDKVRLAYPKSWDDVDTSNMSEEEVREYSHPDNIYLDVHVVCADPNFDVDTIPEEKLVLDVNIAGWAYKNDRVTPVTEEWCVDDPDGLNGVECNTYELELVSDTQLNIAGYSKVEELAVDKLYQLKKVTYKLNSGKRISGRKGSTRLVSNLVDVGDERTHIQVIGRNMLVEPLPRNHANVNNQPVSVTRHVGGLYSVTGTPTGNSLFVIENQMPTNAYTNEVPIILKAGIQYVVYGCVVDVIDFETFRNLFEGGNTKPTAVDGSKAYYGYATDRVIPKEVLLPVELYDRVVWRTSLYLKGKNTYDNMCYYPQICRADVGVINVSTNVDPENYVVSPMPYSPKAFPTVGWEVSPDGEPNNRYVHMSPIGIEYAEEIDAYSRQSGKNYGSFELEVAVDAMDELVKAVLAELNK